jgi:uncharacterized damage-inducible protein DinB
MKADDRVDPPLKADEATTIRAFLDYHRDTLRWKVDGLDQQQLAQPLAPSTMTLGGMLKHLALVESSWFEAVLLGGSYMPPFDTVDWDADNDWDWHSAADDTPEQLMALFDEAVRRADAAIDRTLATPTGLDTESVRKSRHTGEHFTLRWILLHMVEEYARHNGHADLLREAIDGSTGE